MEADPKAAATGERLGRYQVIRHLASGGMADVLLARASGIEGFERHVVLKRIRAEHAKDERFIKMFLDEARLAASLHHQNVVQVNDVGEEKGEFFFAMEFIHGEDLRSVLHRVVRARTQVPLQHVVAIASAIAAGLHYAHEKKGADGKPLGIVHRDVSLSNILVGYDGAVKVVDFGIAKAAQRQAETRSGTLKGKVAYMSPEQCVGAAIDRRSDVWGIGVILYELATAARLFTGDTDYVIMNKIVGGQIPSPLKRRPDLPSALVKIMQRALTVDLAKRFQTAGEMRQALDKLAADAGLVSTATSLADWIEGMFGTTPEPWLGEQSSGFSGSFDAAKPGERTTSVERPALAELAASARAKVDPLADTRSMTRSAEAAADNPPTAATTTSATKSRTRSLAWHRIARPMSGLSGKQKAAVAAGLVALAAGVVALELSGREREPAQVAGTAPATAVSGSIPAPAPAPAGGVVPTDPQGPATAIAPTTEPAVTAPAVEPAPAAVPPAPVTPAAPVPVVGKHDSKRGGKHDDRRPVAVATAPGAANVTGALAPPAPTPTPAPVPVPVPAAPVAPPTPAAPAPAPAAPAVIPMAVVQRVAANYEAALSSKCESTEDLKGEVTVRMQVDADGKVTHTQVSSTIGKPKIAACIAVQVKSWRFPKRPGEPVASATYSVVFQ